ncbi:hypothetical protein [Nocardioides zeae]|nr:hypothetical protein [Nocardioides zeae]
MRLEEFLPLRGEVALLPEHDRALGFVGGLELVELYEGQFLDAVA